MPPLSIMLKPASSMCNMSCDYCFYHDETIRRSVASYGLMTEETLKNIIRRTLTRAEGYISYACQGGEPTLAGLDFFRKMVQYEKQYNQKGIRIQNALQTNGLLLDEDWCAFLKENEFLVGLSMDGSAAVHDLYRKDRAGNGTFSRVRRAADLMQRTGVEFNILTVVTADVCHHIEEIYSYYKQSGWMYQQYIACLEPMDGSAGGAWSLDPETYGRFLIRLFDLWHADVLAGRQPFIRQFDNYVALAAGYIPEACDQRGTCGIQYAVEADGSVYPCDFYMTDAYRLGSFNQDRLDTIDARRREIRFIERSTELDEACRDCPYKALCRGGCYRNRSEGEEVMKNRLCAGYQMFFAVCGGRIYELARRVRGTR